MSSTLTTVSLIDPPGYPQSFRVIRLVIHIDGLLVRFGRTLPDAIAMLEGVSHIIERISHIGQVAILELWAVRFQPDTVMHGPSSQQGLADELSRLNLVRYFQPIHDRLRVIPSVETLAREWNSQGSASFRVLFLSRNHQQVQRAIGSGFDSFHMCESGLPGEHWLSLGEVTRILEETLHIPTARPMSRIARRGALLAVPVASQDDARKQALDAIRHDPQADWVVLGDTLILYTEDTDLEDSLCEDPRVRLLNGSVNKEQLLIARKLLPGATLYQSDTFSVQESSTLDSGDKAMEGTMTWIAARRRWHRQQPGILPPPHLQHTPNSIDVFRFIKNVGSFSTLENDIGLAPQALLSNLERWLPPQSAPDILTVCDQPVALHWMSPYRSTESDQLVVIIYDLPSDRDDSYPDSGRPALALAAGIDSALATVLPSLGVVHCVRLDPNTPIKTLLSEILLQQEQGRIAAVTLLEGFRFLEQPDTMLQLSSCRKLAKRLDLVARINEYLEWTVVTGSDSEVPAILEVQVKTVDARDTDTLTGRHQALDQLLGILATLIAD